MNVLVELGEPRTGLHVLDVSADFPASDLIKLQTPIIPSRILKLALRDMDVFLSEFMDHSVRIKAWLDEANAKLGYGQNEHAWKRIGGAEKMPLHYEYGMTLDAHGLSGFSRANKLN